MALKKRSQSKLLVGLTSPVDRWFWGPRTNTTNMRFSIFSIPYESENSYNCTVAQKTVSMFGCFAKINEYLNNHIVKHSENFRHNST